MHWFDEHAKRILKERGKTLVVATGITPSGPIHIGNLREILTADFVVKAIGSQADTTFYYITDDFDPLRKIYPFLDKRFEQHIGKPYFLIPCPCGEHGSYAEHFLQPFLEALKSFGVSAKTLRVSELYRSGRYTDAIIKAVEGREKIKAILEQVSQRSLGGDWFPFNPLCGNCQKLRGKVTDFDLTKHTVSYECPDCGSGGVANFSKGEGKLPWRIDWPARWWALGVNVEPVGKDHASHGGSYETGKRIAKEIFQFPAPYPIVYERVHLRGEGAMHSSTGIAIAASEILKAVSPTVIRFFFAKSQPDRHINFDPGEGLIQLYDEYTAADPKDPVRTVATVERLPHISYRHLLTIYQAAQGKQNLIKKSLARSGLAKEEIDVAVSFMERLGVWLQTYAPERVKFEVSQTLPAAAKRLSRAQKQFLASILKKYQSKKTWQGDELQGAIHELRKASDIEAKDAFVALYLVFTGKDSGPQAGWFLASLGKDFVIQRLSEV
ncbi:lysine--tRNA ligase [Candidatus Berkelbacteria bacterium]|nr:lysine--tRNA ligase [Candidatus Berkelbacteria bacterium]